MNLAFPGAAKTGTTSMWEMFRHHPQVATSVEKEYFIDCFNRKEYLKTGFNINEETKLLFDGSPNLGFFKGWLRILKTIEGIDNIYIIYVLRNIKERLISVSTTATRKKLAGKERFPYRAIQDRKLNLHKLHWIFMRRCFEFCYLRRIEEVLCLDKNNIIVVNLENVNEKEKQIQELLGLEYHKLKFRKLNTVNDYTPTMEGLFIKKEIIDYLDEFSYKYEAIWADQRKKISERYNII